MQWYDSAYVRLIRQVERLFPGPARLGAPLDAAGHARAAKADPVLLVHGMGNSPQTWDEVARSLTADGFSVHRAKLPDGGMGDAHVAARSLGRQARDVQRTTGRDVQLLAFSYGGIVSRVHLELRDGWNKGVSNLVTIATPHHGTLLAEPLAGHAPQAAAVRDLAPSSSVIRSLDAAYDARDGARYTSVYAHGFDGFVLPADSAALEGATNVPLAAKVGTADVSLDPNHYSIVHQSDAAYTAARTALLR
jgi:triacylglycerol lipase